MLKQFIEAGSCHRPGQFWRTRSKKPRLVVSSSAGVGSNRLACGSNSDLSQRQTGSICSSVTGDGSCDHLDGSVSLPKEIRLANGLFEVNLSGFVPSDFRALYSLTCHQVGREAPADIVVPVPTVSTRHAMLRLGMPTMSYVRSKHTALSVTLGIAAENDTLSITDLNSTNGTYVDDEELVPMRAMEVAVGAEVIFGVFCNETVSTCWSVYVLCTVICVLLIGSSDRHSSCLACLLVQTFRPLDLWLLYLPAVQGTCFWPNSSWRTEIHDSDWLSIHHNYVH